MATPTATVVDINSLLDSRVGYRDGRPFIRGRRIGVDDVAARHARGDSFETIRDDFALEPEQMHAALAYYYLHKDAMEEQWERDAEEAEDEARRLGIRTL